MTESDPSIAWTNLIVFGVCFVALIGYVAWKLR